MASFPDSLIGKRPNRAVQLGAELDGRYGSYMVVLAGY